MTPIDQTEALALPHLLHEAESIMPPWLAWLISGAIILFWVLLAVVILYFILRRFLSKPVMDPDSLYARETSIDEHISNIKNKYLASTEYRAGLHALSDLMRRHWTETQRMKIKPMTSYEMGYYFETEYPADLFRTLNQWQFDKNEPGEEEFLNGVELCRSNHRARLRPRKGKFLKVTKIFSKSTALAQPKPVKSQNALDALLERKE